MGSTQSTWGPFLCRTASELFKSGSVYTESNLIYFQVSIKTMAVKDKSDSTKEVSEGTSIEWNVENELQLLLVLCGTKPIGISKYFQMACIVEKLSSNLNKEITAKSVWDHLGT